MATESEAEKSLKEVKILIKELAKVLKAAGVNPRKSSKEDTPDVYGSFNAQEIQGVVGGSVRGAAIEQEISNLGKTCAEILDYLRRLDTNGIKIHYN